MITTVNQLTQDGMPAPICIGIHAIFANDAYQKLLVSGVSKVVTCNTIDHPSNAIDVSDTLLNSLKLKRT